MARYILLEVDDNEAAGDLVTSIQDNLEVFFYKKDNEADSDELSPYTVQRLFARVRGLYMKPTKFCECNPFTGTIILGDRFKLMVHRVCMRPVRGQWQHPRNLLETVETTLMPHDKSKPKRIITLGTCEGITPEQHP
jgi:hypothetical protein